MGGVLDPDSGELIESAKVLDSFESSLKPLATRFLESDRTYRDYMDELQDLGRAYTRYEDREILVLAQSVSNLARQLADQTHNVDRLLDLVQSSHRRICDLIEQYMVDTKVAQVRADHFERLYKELTEGST